MAKNEFPLPDVGEGLTEAEIVSWKVAPGDAVTVNQVLVEIETAKSLVELPSPFEGTVAELLVAEGDTVEVGRPIITVDSGAPAAADVPPSPAPQADAPAAPEPTLVGYGTAGHGASRRRRGAAASSAAAPSAAAVPAAPTVAPDAEPHAAAAAQIVGDVKPTTGPNPDVPPAQPELATWAQPPAEPAAAPVPVPAAAPAEAPTGVLAKPPVRKLAKDLDVDLATVTATGPAGDVTRDDVLRHARQASALAVAPVAPASKTAQGDAREERIPVKGVRKAIAGAMVASAFTAPHVSLFVDVDATRTMEFVKRLKNSSEFEGVRVSPLLIMAKAIIWAAKRNPTVNSQWTDDEIIVKHFVNLGIAATTPRGLLVPNVKEAQSMSLLELATALQGLTLRAREGKTTPAEMAGGTITITNIGVFGMDTGTPILNPGEVAIVALGTIKQKPWVVDGVVQPRFITTVGASFDHRVVDGDVASRFVADVASILEEPALLLE